MKSKVGHYVVKVAGHYFKYKKEYAKQLLQQWPESFYTFSKMLLTRSLCSLTRCQESVPRWQPGCLHCVLWPTCTSRGHQWSGRLQSAPRWSLQTLPEFLTSTPAHRQTDHRAPLDRHQVAATQRETCTGYWPKVEPLSFDCFTTNSSWSTAVITWQQIILTLSCTHYVYLSPKNSNFILFFGTPGLSDSVPLPLESDCLRATLCLKSGKTPRKIW